MARPRAVAAAGGSAPPCPRTGRGVGDLTKRTRLSDAAAGTFGVKILVLLASLIASIVTARLLGPEGRGHLALLLLLPALADAVGQLGIGSSMNYLGGRVPRATLLLNAFLCTLAAAILATAGALVAAAVLRDTVFTGVPLDLLVVAAALTFATMLVDFLTRGLQAIYEIRTFNLIQLLNPIAYPILVVVFVGLLGWGLPGAVVAFAIATLATLGLGAWVLAGRAQFRDARFDGALAKEILSFGAKAHVGNIAKKLVYRLDVFIVAFFLDPVAVGCYALALTIAELAWRVPESVSDVLLPRLSHEPMRPEFTASVCRQMLLIVAATCVALFALREPLVTIPFGEAFAPAITPLALILPGVLALSVLKVLAADFNARGEPLRYSVATGVALVVMVALDLLLIPRYGLAGAAIASSIAYATGTLAMLLMYRALTGLRIVDLLLPRVDDVRHLRDTGARMLQRIRGTSA